MQTESSSQDQIVVAAAALQMNEGPQAQERSAAPAEVNQLECRECVSAHRIMSLNAQDSASRAKIRAFKPNYNAGKLELCDFVCTSFWLELHTLLYRTYLRLLDHA